MTKFSKSDLKFFELARQEATCSTYKNFHLGAVVVYKGRVVSSGRNSDKTHPEQKKYNDRYRHFKYGPQLIKDTLHAEMAALLSIPYTIEEDMDWSKAKVYVYRISVGRESGKGMARPCAGCFHALKDKGVRHLYYTTDEGYAYERLD